ncbi:MAG: alkaline phosphatase family protein, partial [Planctomycetia bacterium]|nr:alkaline phosphatase family protein [Planctomycetia bacterium]
SPFLLVVIDGLREAAVASMPAWQALAAEGEATGGTRGAAAASGVALVGDPTMSAPCVRAIVTGRRPDLWTSFRNFDPVPVEGSVIQLLAARRLRVAHAGDGLLPRLCPDAYRPEDVATVPRALLRTVRELDDRTFPRALEFARDPTVDVLTVHLVAVDLTGHASGATGAAYAAAVAEADARLGELVLAFRREHTGAHVLVTADHGLSPAGTHGAGEPEARRAPFVLVGPRVALRRRLEVAQEALASTVAVMLHLRPPPLAEAPPVLGVLRLTTAERRAALDAFAAARAAALVAAGRSLEAHALEEVRAAAAAGGRGGPGEPALLRALMALDAPPARRAAAPVAALALA